MAASTVERRADERESLFERLYAEHQPTLHAYFLGRTSDPELAVDLVQEAFIRAWRSVDTLRPLTPERQRAWIFTVARNLVIDQYGGRATRAAVQDALAASAEQGEQAAPAPEVAVER